MPEYRYTALAPDGHLVRGAMRADSAAAVMARLKRRGQVGLRADPADDAIGWFAARLPGRRAPAVARRDLPDLIRELATMLESGQDLDRALRFLADTARGGRRAVLASLRDAVRNGEPLSDAMGRHPDSFPRLVVGLARAGEAGGALGGTLERVATLLERRRALAASLATALIYPAVLTLAACGSVFFLLTWVLPQFTPLFQQGGAALPLPTRVLVAVGDWASAWGAWALAATGLIGLALAALLRRPGGRAAGERLLLRLPVAGPLAREVLAARLTRTLGTLLANGVPLIRALATTREAMGHLLAARAIDRAAEGARGGAGLAAALEAERLFPARTVHMLRLGEETARLGPMALRAADMHEDRVRAGAQRLVALLVPAITVAMGALVAAIVASLLLAMLSLNDLAG